MGQAAYERDSVTFDKIEYSWQLLSVLMYICALNKGNLNVIDFGGSLGTTYFQNQIFLNELNSVQWNIVEQAKFVQFGKKNFQDNKLSFYNSIEECLKSASPDVILFSSVLQYIEKPYELLNNIISQKLFKYIIIDLTTFITGDREYLSSQKVHPEIYKASYPCWFFNEEFFFSMFTNRYTFIEKWERNHGKIFLNNKRAHHMGYFFKKIIQ